MPWRTITSFAQDLEPSIRAASRPGPKTRRPRAVSSSARPATSGASGPTTVRSTSSRSTSATMPGTSSAVTSTQRADDAIPAFPGAASSVLHERAPRQPPHEGVLAAAPADDQDLHPTGRLCSRAGPIDTTDTGTPTSSASRCTYARASFGRSSNDVASSISSIQPSSSS